MRVTGLYIYPLKGARAVALDEVAIEPRGPAGDRRWMAVDEDGAMLSQREVPGLARVDAALRSDGGLALAIERHGAIEVVRPDRDAPRRRVTIWGDAVDAALADPAACAWLSAALGRAAALVHLPDDVVRAVDPVFAAPGDQVSFADGYPVLLASEASLADLVARMGAPLPMDRFRPNLVVDGDRDAPYAEDGWRRIRAGAVELVALKPCGRCVVTTRDQRTGAAGVEPLRTLATYRPGPSGVRFGHNLVPATAGIIRLGDPVAVL